MIREVDRDDGDGLLQPVAVVDGLFLLGLLAGAAAAGVGLAVAVLRWLR